jgi:hypothetical protein
MPDKLGTQATGGTVSKWREKFKVHPAADVFPEMSDEELKELGEDIGANGLRHSIVFHLGLLIDGRNRLEAMERAGLVSPRPNKTSLPHDADLRTALSGGWLIRLSTSAKGWKA